MEEIRVCASCGYSRGFHVYFRPEEGRHRIGLICPNCGQSYDIGWLTPEVGGKPLPGPVFPSK